MIIQIDDDSLKDKSKEEISKIITDTLNGEFNFPGIKIYGEPPEDLSTLEYNNLEYNNLEYNYLKLEFKEDLRKLINHYSIENDTNTPDWCIADYLINCLLSMTCIINGRDIWYKKE